MGFADYNGPFSFASRFEEGAGTNPEELVGAAHAGCYSMFLSALITEEGLTPERVSTTAHVHLGSDETGPVITGIDLKCEVMCEGLTIDKFKELAATAKEKCPISRLYAPTDIRLDARMV